MSHKTVLKRHLSTTQADRVLRPNIDSALAIRFPNPRIKWWVSGLDRQQTVGRVLWRSGGYCDHGIIDESTLSLMLGRDDRDYAIKEPHAGVKHAFNDLR